MIQTLSLGLERFQALLKSLDLNVAFSVDIFQRLGSLCGHKFRTKKRKKSIWWSWDIGMWR
jgi:hypothetical protein